MAADVVLGTLLHRAAHLASMTFQGEFGQFPDSLPEAPAEEMLQLESGTIHSLRWQGQGDPIVVLHGLNSNAWMWGRLGGLLGGGRPVIALTLPGHGLSSPCPEGADYGAHAMALRLLEAVDHVAPERLSLAGHSYGGKIGLALAGILGDRVRALSLADPVLPQGLNRLARALPGVASAIFAPERGPFPDTETMERTLKQLLYMRRWGDVEQLIAQHSFAQDDQGVWRHRLSDQAFREILFGALAENSSPLLRDVTCPVQLLRPNLTVSFLPGEVAALRKRLQKLEVARVSGDHAFVLTNPKDSAKVMGRFFARN